MSSSSSPIPEARLHEIVQQACDTTFSSATTYNHADTESQNAKIINTILNALVSPFSSNTSTSSSLPSPPSSPSNTAPPSQRQYKYAVNSTIIQHLSSPSTSTSISHDAEEMLAASTIVGGAPAQTQTQQPTKGRRGMHSATGAYWDQSTDGMFSYKWEGAAKGKGLDVVVSVMWVAV